MSYSYDRTASHQAQVSDLVEVLTTVSNDLADPHLKNFAALVVAEVLRKDKDGSLLGTVYHDGFNEAQFVKLLTSKLSSSKVAQELANWLLTEMENQR